MATLSRVASISVEGFGSFQKRQTLELTGGPMAVVGHNGAGKSTLVSKALTWCLYGRTAPERMGSATGAIRGRSVINPEAKQARVVVRIEDGAIIERVRGSKGGDQILIDGVRGEQADIEVLVGVDYDVFTRTCVRGQSDPWNWLEATDGRKREILDVISGADQLAPFHERAQQILRNASTKDQSVRLQCSAAERRVVDLDPSGLRARAKEWDEDHAYKVLVAAQEAQNAFEASERAREEDARYAALRLELPADPSAVVEAADHAVDLAYAENQAALLKQKTAFEDLAELGRLRPGKVCPLCRQGLPDTRLLDERQRELEALIEEAKLQVTATQQMLDARRDHHHAVKVWAFEVTAYRRCILHYAPAHPSAMVEYQHAAVRLQTLRMTANPLKAVIAEAEVKYEEAQREYALLEEAQALAEGEVKYARAWAETLHPKGVRAQLAEAAIYAIEAAANRWLTQLSGELQIVLSPFAEGAKGKREQINVKVLVRGKERELLTFSGGEKRRLNFAVDMGIAKVFTRGGALRLSLLVLDEEISSGLDVEGKTALLNAIHEAGIADVILVDHDPTLSGALPRTIHVVKTLEGSMIQEV